MRIITFLNNPILYIKFREFKEALQSIDVKVIVTVIEGWGRKYFRELWREYLEEINRFLALVVKEIQRRIEEEG